MSYSEASSYDQSSEPSTGYQSIEEETGDESIGYPTEQRSIADDENVPATNYRRFLEGDYYSPRRGYITPSDLTHRRAVNPTTQTEVIWRGLTCYTLPH